MPRSPVLCVHRATARAARRDGTRRAGGDRRRRRCAAVNGGGVRVRAGGAVCVRAGGPVPWLGAPRRGERVHVHACARPAWARGRGAGPVGVRVGGAHEEWRGVLSWCARRARARGRERGRASGRCASCARAGRGHAGRERLGCSGGAGQRDGRHAWEGAGRERGAARAERAVASCTAACAGRREEGGKGRERKIKREMEKEK